MASANTTASVLTTNITWSNWKANTDVKICELLSWQWKAFLYACFSIITVISLPGNTLVCFMVYTRPSMKSAINLLLAHMSLVNILLVTVCMPLTLLQVIGVVNETSLTVKVNSVLFQLFNAEKMLVLVVVSVDRYYIIVKRRNALHKDCTRLLFAFLWLAGVCCTALPIIVSAGRVFAFPACLLGCSGRPCPAVYYVYFSRLLLVFAPVFIVLVLFIKIVKAVRYRHMRIANHPPIISTAMHKKGQL